MDLQAVIDSGIADGIIAGEAVVVGEGNGILWEAGFGEAAPGGVPMTPRTIIDIASVSKVAATTTALLICGDRKLLDFSAPFTDYLPDFTAELPEAVTLRDLAAHVSGFSHEGVTQRQYDAPAGEEIMRNILRFPPARKPGERVEYLCWNFLLLGLIVERVTGERLDTFCEREIFRPLGMKDTSFGKPVTDDPALLAQTVETARPGEISDFIAYRVFRDGGCCGNAGVFSTARDLAEFCRCILNRGAYGDGKRLFSEAMFHEIVTPYSPPGGVMRSFGWATDNPFGTGSCIWHSGWSGQTIFIDFDAGRFAVVLTPRVGDYEHAKRDRFRVIGFLLGNDW